MDFLLLSLTNKAFPFPIFSLFPSLLRFLFFSSLLFFSSSVFATENNRNPLSTQQPCTEHHFSALLHLKQGFHFDGESITTLSSWNPDNRDCCSWEGITCDGVTGHVISLDLSYLGVLGRVEFGSIFHLQTLQILNLAGNNFGRSPIPSGFEQLTSLTHLSLSDSWFQGQIPIGISRLTSLVFLDLSFNGLKLEKPNIGTLVQNLSSLRELHLNWVDIFAQGSEWGPAISALPQLRRLTMIDCGLSGPIHPSLSKLHFLSTLALTYNNLSSAIPNFIGNFSSLTSLVLVGCGLHGKFPESIFRLPNLQALAEGNNPLLTGEIPQNNTIRKLWVSNTGFCSKVQDSFGNFKLLTELFLGSCNLSGPFPSWLFKLDKLVILDLSSNGFSGPLPSSLVKLNNLVHLDLSSNGFSGPIPSSYGKKLRNLQKLNIYNNSLSGTIPSSLFSLTSLLSLELQDNEFSGDVNLGLLRYLKNLLNLDISNNNFCTSLQVLDLSDNHFNGSIPPCFGEISDALVVLNLGGNAFHGTLLQTFKEGCTIETLCLNENQLEGQVPRSLAKCKKLELHSSLPSNMFKSWKAMMEDGKSQSQFLSKKFVVGYYQDKVIIVSKGLELELVKILTAYTVVDISNNQFHGDIPKSIGDVKSLHVLNMSYNCLTGQIPASLEGINDLESLDLSHNNLSGEIPQHLTKLTFIAVLDLSYNHLVGSIPQGQQFSTFTNKSFLGNLGLCGPPLSKKCEYIKASPPLAQSESKYDWEFMWIGFGVGYGVGMGILFWTLALWKKGMREFTIFVDRMLLIIFPCEAFILMHRY
ncbi:receptor-like protein Cf-9 [Magnolia sinica]|uniref:receptor-like protein Cf-9 n=1 Tax=Magnolia sinica TaxID=86752 RepID=UPI0026592A16|nr:receptor-like protein Cf-9 [Magnolia sinica]